MTDFNPLVSVLIPCYNASAYVEKAVHSIINQTYKNLEILLIDDGSTDDTLIRLKSLKDKRIKLFEFKENTKKVGAVNNVLRKATGDFIAFQDADDWSEPDRIYEQLNRFYLQEGTGICFTKYRYTGSKTFVPKKIALTDKQLKDEFLHFGCKQQESLSPTICATMMITKDVLIETGGYHPFFGGRVAEDIHWIYRILKKFSGIAIDKPLYNVRSVDESLTWQQASGKNAKSAYSWQLLSKIIYKDIHENIDVLDAAHIDELKTLELMACEEALSASIISLNEMKNRYENSTSYKLGRFILSPFRILKNNKFN